MKIIKENLKNEDIFNYVKSKLALATHTHYK